MKKGFTLVEMLIVISIMVILAVTMIGILNPVALVNKGYDTQRKKDLERIKVAMEEYFNDNRCYPLSSVVTTLNDPSSCNSSIAGFSSLNPWPCDPATKKPYIVVADPSPDCPKWFGIFTKLQNSKDSEIPTGWTNSQYNFGVSSTNVNWFDLVW